MHIPSRLAAAAAIVLALALAGGAAASERIAKETSRSCTDCHDKPGSKRLTDPGKYFETMRSFQGYEQLRQSFGSCTACHDRRPGSRKLTKKGREFAQMVKDMPGLAKWMQEGHPKPSGN